MAQAYCSSPKHDQVVAKWNTIRCCQHKITIQRNITEHTHTQSTQAKSRNKSKCTNAFLIVFQSLNRHMSPTKAPMTPPTVSCKNVSIANSGCKTVAPSQILQMLNSNHCGPITNFANAELKSMLYSAAIFVLARLRTKPERTSCGF